MTEIIINIIAGIITAFIFVGPPVLATVLVVRVLRKRKHLHYGAGTVEGEPSKGKHARQ